MADLTIIWDLKGLNTFYVYGFVQTEACLSTRCLLSFDHKMMLQGGQQQSGTF